MSLLYASLELGQSTLPLCVVRKKSVVGLGQKVEICSYKITKP